MNEYDVIVIGAGSVGLPLSMSLGEKGLKTLVLEQRPSPGQGENKHAIGGIRATHSDPAKILTCQRSLEIFSTWEERYGNDIEWTKGGYTFPVYREQEEKALKGILPVQKEFGLNIDYHGPDKISEIVPGINPDGLMGGTFSPDDGSASPLMSAHAFYKHGLSNRVEYFFKEGVNKVIAENGKAIGVSTDKGTYFAETIVDAAGPHSPDIFRDLGIELPVIPDSHEGAITEPVKRFFEPMVVDLRPGPGSKNYYFYQNMHGQVVFCITPDPPITGMDKRETSIFLPQVAKRMVNLLPRLKNIRVRRVWRGLYPMTPDGSPVVGWNKDIKGILHLTGMCGQGYMLGPGIGEVGARMITDQLTADDKVILEGFDLYREFGGGVEALK